jgi:hypothetical protein
MSLRRLALVLALGWSLAGLFSPAPAAADARQAAASTGYVDWERQVAVGVGTAPVRPSAAGPTQARALAQRAAMLDARRNLLEVVGQVQVDSASWGAELHDRIRPGHHHGARAPGRGHGGRGAAVARRDLRGDPLGAPVRPPDPGGPGPGPPEPLPAPTPAPAPRTAAAGSDAALANRLAQTEAQAALLENHAARLEIRVAALERQAPAGPVAAAQDPLPAAATRPWPAACSGWSPESPWWRAGPAGWKSGWRPWSADSAPPQPQRKPLRPRRPRMRPWPTG